VELGGENGVLDLSRQEADLAIRLSRPEVPGLVARWLGELALACYAAAADWRPFEAQVFLSFEDASDLAAPQRYLSALVPPDRMVLRSTTMQALVAAARGHRLRGTALLLAREGSGAAACARAACHAIDDALAAFL
jgi:hypothetical protein